MVGLIRDLDFIYCSLLTLFLKKTKDTGSHIFQTVSLKFLIKSATALIKITRVFNNPLQVFYPPNNLCFLHNNKNQEI